MCTMLQNNNIKRIKTPKAQREGRGSNCNSLVHIVEEIKKKRNEHSIISMRPKCVS